MDWHPDRAKDPELSTKVFQWLQAIETAAETAAGGKGLFVSSSVYGEVPSGYVKIAIENGPVERVDFPIDSMVDLSSSLFVCLPGLVN